jgi:phosphatidylcholine synthase
MFTPLKFIHPVRTQRWRSISLPIAIIWTALAGLSAWTNFNAGPLVTSALAITSVYLLTVGIIQQLFPAKDD